MSLSRILNNEPSDRQPASAPAGAIDPALMDSSAPSSPSHSASQPPRGSSSNVAVEHPPQPRGLSYQSPPYDGAGGWNPYTGEWMQGGPFPLGRGGNYYDRTREQEREDADGTPESSMASDTGSRTHNGHVEGNGRKRRKTSEQHQHDGVDQAPASQKRYGLRRHPPKNKQYMPPTPPPAPAVPLPEAELVAEEYQPTEEELRLASSDLEDCEEIWRPELDEYALDSYKRQRYVKKWFDKKGVDYGAEVAMSLAQYYTDRIAAIPLPPPPPPPPPYMIPPMVDANTHPAHPRSPSIASVEEYDPYAEQTPYDPGDEAVDAAQELEDSLLGPSGYSSTARNRGHNQQPVSEVTSDDESELDVPPPSHAPAVKKRRIDKSTHQEILLGPEAAAAHGQHLDGQLYSASGAAMSPSKLKGKAKTVDSSAEVLSATSKGRKKPGPKRKLDALPPHTQEQLGVGPSTISRDQTPATSRPASPAPGIISAVYELDEDIPPLKKARKVDDVTMMKRVRNLEETQRKVWTNIARRDVGKVYKYQLLGYQARQAQSKRTAMLVSMQARKPYTRTTKGIKEAQAKGKRLMREMLVTWKKSEKEERDVRKREQKEAVDRAKVEEEKREAARQARKLEFLISQTELYSHFVGNKLKTAEIEGEEAAANAMPAGADYESSEANALNEIDFDDEDQTNLYRHASRNAQEALAAAREKAQYFDKQAALERKTNEALKLAKGQAHIRDDSMPAFASSATPLVDLDSDELNFQNPTSLMGDLKLDQPKMLNAQLKEYQLKGLNWLATLYEQGINGILADEMGLGKTIQSISLMAYLAEAHDIWGPFLVVSPASTLHNWQQELTRFVPKLKALPYWGNVKDRATLRKVWGKKEISYNEDAPFHVLITSYQLVTQDQQYFQRVKWQYMILDEAQNIKNSSSVRWKTLLGFNCRNRLLLTGTPIQNSMQELWALLHFIMPSLFDSHDEFNEWFSKDIENAAENKGSKLNEHQLRRLHMILKPFMLRRVKRHVQNELSEKIEKDVYVDLSARQRALYKGLLSNVSVAELLEKAATVGSDADSARSLMNLVMQFRKVCNHPELFERADVVSPFSFCLFGQSGPLNREGDIIYAPYSTRNPIEYSIPELFYRDGGLVTLPHENALAKTGPGCLAGLMNIWSTNSIHRSLVDDARSSWSFLRVLNISPAEAHAISVSPLVTSRLQILKEEASRMELEAAMDSDAVAHQEAQSFCMTSPTAMLSSMRGSDLPPPLSISTAAWQQSCFSRPEVKLFLPAVVAPPIAMYCRDRSYLEKVAATMDSPLESLALYGMPPSRKESEDSFARYQRLLPGVPPSGIFNMTAPDQLPPPPMQVPEAKKLIYDSSKLAALDSLLQELKTGDHRVLIYSQMTRMLDLMEEYLIYRQYKYLRLDGSSKLEDRRDMVIEWQTRPDIFVFLLSTRAGGLGINLTAADTVVFYDHDWNPSNDAQAMDRAHRLGQTRQVTVYRLITKGTIDERIVQLARVKKDVQDIVVGNKTLTDVAKPSEIVQLLLNEDQLANLDRNSAQSAKSLGKRPAGSTNGTAQVAADIWNEEGDDFFGHSGPAPTPLIPDSVVEDIGAVATSTRGKRRRGGAGGSTSRGRGAGSRGGRGGRRKKTAGADAA